MASEVNMRTIPLEVFSSSSRRYNRNLLTRAFRLHRHFQPTGVSARLHQTALRGQNPPARCQGQPAARLTHAPQKLLRAPRRPGKATRSRSAEWPQFGNRLDARAVSGLSSTNPVRILVKCRRVAGANQSHEVGSNDAARLLGILAVPLGSRSRRAFVPGCLSSVVQLPDTPGSLFMDRS